MCTKNNLNRKYSWIKSWIGDESFKDFPFKSFIISTNNHRLALQPSHGVKVKIKFVIKFFINYTHSDLEELTNFEAP